jgi:hypothetical protein
MSALSALFLTTSCAVASDPAQPPPDRADTPAQISNFEECAAAGNPIAKSYPPQCHTADGRVFVKELPSLNILTPPQGGGCKNLCGDGKCQEIVCMAVGCPCPESPERCPQDCR